MEKRPLISFILPYYDLPVRMLHECIDSILALSLRPFEREIIVVDDGSEKSPVSELSAYHDDIIYIRQRNKGLSETRNTGLRMAQGDYIQFLDADDRLIQAPYEHCIDLARFGHYELVAFDFTKTDSHAESASTCTDTDYPSGSDYMRQRNIHGTAWGYLFRRSVLGDLRFTPGIVNEDEEFTPLLLLRTGPMCTTDAKAYYYRERPNSIITSSHVRNKLRRLNDLKGVIMRLNTTADRLPTSDRQAMQRRVAQLTMDYLYNVIRQTQSRHFTERKIEELRKAGLFPLPDRDYTTKYTWFRKMTNSPAGISVLMRLIPILNKER